MLVLFLTVFIDLVGFGLIIPLIPYLARWFSEQGIEGGLYVGIVMASYSFMQFLFAPLWGKLSDKYGRKPIILISLLGAALSHLLFALTTSFAMILIARSFAGLFGANISTAMAAMADLSDRKNRSKAMGLIGAAFGLGFIFGPFIGGLSLHVSQSQGWSLPPFDEHLPALVASVICFINFIFAIFFLKETNKDRNTSKATSISLTTKLMAVFRVLNFKIPLNALYVMALTSALAMSIMEVVMFVFVDEKFNLSLKQASFGFAYIGVIIALTQGGLYRKLANKYSSKSLLYSGLVLLTLSFFLLPASPNLWFFALAITLFGVSNGIMNPSLQGLISLQADKYTQGSILGVSQSMSALGRIIGPMMGGTLMGYGFIHSPFILAGALSFISFAIWLSIKSEIKN